MSYEEIVAGLYDKKLEERYGTAGGERMVKLTWEWDPDGVNGRFQFNSRAGNRVEIFGGAQFSNALGKMGMNSGVTTAPDRNTPIGRIEDPSLTGSFSITINGRTITIDKFGDGTGTDDENPERRGDTLNDIMWKINNSGAGVQMFFDQTRGAYVLQSTRTGSAGEIKFGSDGNLSNTSDPVELADHLRFLDLFGLRPGTLNMDDYRISRASNAEFEFNGQTFYRENNEFEVNGINVRVNEGVQIGQPIFISLQRDVSGTMNTIQKFVDEYNALIEALHRHTGTPRARSGQYTYYEPLTDEQKESMKDREIELWEEKARTGMLHRDPIVQNITAQMRRMLYERVEVGVDANGNRRFLSLHQIGITTSQASGNIGKLTIDEGRLRRALEENVADVNALFTKRPEFPPGHHQAGQLMPGTTVAQRNARMMRQGVADRLNDIIDNAIAFGGSIYNRAGFEDTSSAMNNDIFRQIENEDAKIAQMIQRLIQKENEYFMMFSRMETAMAQSQTQMDSLYAMLGMGMGGR